MHVLRKAMVVVVGILAVTAVVASSASAALPEFEPAKNKLNETKLKAGSGEAIFEIKEEIGQVKCSSVGFTAGTTNEVTGAKSGVFDLLFLGCKDSLNNTCTGLSDTAAGSILVKGHSDLRYMTKVEAKETGLGLLLEEVHFTCGANLFKTRGCVIGPITPVNTAGVATYTLTLKQTGGKNAFTEMFNEANSAKETCKLEGSKNEAAFKQAGEQATSEITAETAGKINA